MRKKPLWRKLFVAYLWAPVLLLSALGLFGSHLVTRLYEEHLVVDLEDRAKLCGQQIEALLARGENAEIDPLCKRLGRATGTRITVILPTGEVVGDSHADPSDMDNHRLRPEMQTALGGRVGRENRYSSTLREQRMYTAVPLIGDGAPAAVVRTSFSVAELNRTLDEFRDDTIAAVLICVFLSAAVSLFISRRMSRPLEEIRAGAERFAAGELDHRLPIGGADEIDAVTKSLNRMAEQLDERIQTVSRQREEREAMLSSMEEGVLAIDNEGTIISLNQTCADLLDGTPDKLRGRTIYEVIRKPDLLKLVEAALAGQSPVEEEVQLRGPSDRWLTAHGTALHDPERGTIGVLVVLHDITRLRHLEQVRRDFVANVSHELRTPVTSIKGFIETLLDGALESKEDSVRFLNIMLRQVNRLEAIIADLLALSRVERGADELMIEVGRESIPVLLQGAVETCEKKAADKGVKIEVSCPEELTWEVNGALLEQAVINLIDNAVKYSDAGLPVELTAEQDGSELVIQVKDHGCGIESKHLSRLFERFYRVDKARSRELGGTGLGLAIVKHIALAHRGTIEVDSAIGEGSRFTLRLPIAPSGSQSS
ncbi:MAG: HAMP domain-containing protein [Pirellulales bacterium]|nr:HAMP domain-containing protein [Pirellulales bacterium]